MDKNDIIKILRKYKKDVAEQYNILTIGVFGSVTRSEAGEDSDVDVVIRILEPDLFMLSGIKNDLEAIFCRPVDIVTYQGHYESVFKKKNR